MADLMFLIEGILSIAAVAAPVGVILVLLVAGDYTISDLFMAPSWDDRGNGPLPIHDEVAPRWRLERLRPRGEGAGPVTNASREDASSASSAVGTFAVDS